VTKCGNQMSTHLTGKLVSKHETISNLFLQAEDLGALCASPEVLGAPCDAEDRGDSCDVMPQG